MKYESMRVCVRMCYVRTLKNDKIRSRRNKTGSSSNNSSLNNNSAGSAAPGKTVVSTSSSSSSKRGGVPFHLRSSYPVPARKNHVASGCGTNAGNPDRANRSVCGYSPCPPRPLETKLLPLLGDEAGSVFRKCGA